MTPKKRGECLSEIVEGLKNKPVTWGEDDCSMIAAQWVSDLTGKELSSWPMYDNEEGAARVIENGGGLVSVWSAVLAEAGVPEWDGESIEIGDVGIIETSLGPVGGIFLHGGTFLWRAENGVRILGVRRNKILKVWKVASE